jgi:hypothetical protein
MFVFVVFSTRIELVGFNTTEGHTDFQSSMSVVMTGVNLIEGRLKRFFVYLIGSDCDISFQIWRLDDRDSVGIKQYTLVFQTPYLHFTSTGYYEVKCA